MCEMVSKEVAKDLASVYMLYKRKQHLHPKDWHKGPFSCCTWPVGAEPGHQGGSGPRHHRVEQGKLQTSKGNHLSNKDFSICICDSVFYVTFPHPNSELPWMP